jgi:hypothetical protein
MTDGTMELKICSCCGDKYNEKYLWYITGMYGKLYYRCRQCMKIIRNMGDFLYDNEDSNNDDCDSNSPIVDDLPKEDMTDEETGYLDEETSQYLFFS